MIDEAPSESDIRMLLNYGNLTKPSGRIRRDWLKAAKKRKTQLHERV